MEVAPEQAVVTKGIGRIKSLPLMNVWEAVHTALLSWIFALEKDFFPFFLPSTRSQSTFEKSSCWKGCIPTGIIVVL